MFKHTLIVVLATLMILTVFVSSQPVHAFSFTSILTAAKAATNLLKTVNTSKITFPFGGKIVDSGKACTIHYWMSYPVPFPPYYVTHLGPPIPIGGTKISVDPPGIPTDEAYTFPFISQIYNNHNENEVGVWTLGIGLDGDFFKAQVIDRINDALGSIPAIQVGPVTFFNFSLSCPDGGVILKIGTS